MPDYQRSHLGSDQKSFRLRCSIFVSSRTNNLQIAVAENNRGILFICTTHSPWVSEQGQWLGLGWFCLILSSLREAGQQWNSLDSVAQGRHSTGGCALALKTCLPPESVLFLLWSHSIDQSKSHGISDFKEVRSADSATCMKEGNPCRTTA